MVVESIDGLAVYRSMGPPVEYYLKQLVETGYLILSYSDRYCSCIKEINGQDRYVLLELVDGHWLIKSC